MKVLCVDDEAVQRQQMESSIKALGHSTHACNGAKALALTRDDVLAFDVAVVDQNLESDIAGEKVGQSLRSKNPRIVLIMLTAYSSVERAMQAVKSEGFDDYIAKNTGRTQELLQKALLTAETQTQLTASRQVAHGSSPLFANTRHLVGIDRVLCELAERLEAFFMWQADQWDSWSEEDRPKFVSCLLLDGEPGCAKTDICRGIVTAFANDERSFIPKDLGPTHIAKGWKRVLRESLEPLYRKAVSTSKVVVIVADDLAWPSVASMQTGEMAAEWQNYMQAVRDCIKDADRINKGQGPLVPWVKDISQKWSGRILWLLAKNTTEEVGQAYAPIVDFMNSFRLEFPRQDLPRRQILDLYAQRHGMKFTQGAAALAVASLRPPAYRGREFVGDESSGKGFAYWCVERVKRARREGQTKGVAVPKLITETLVQEWLGSEQHRTIIGAPSDWPVVVPKVSIGSGSEDKRSAYWKTLIADELERLNAAFPAALESYQKYRAKMMETGSQTEPSRKLRTREEVRQDDFVESLKALYPDRNYSRPKAGALFRFSEDWEGIPKSIRSTLIKEVANESPGEWTNLRSSQSPFAKFL